MLAWVMNLGFAASSGGTPAVAKSPRSGAMGMSMMKLGGASFCLLVMLFLR